MERVSVKDIFFQLYVLKCTNIDVMRLDVLDFFMKVRLLRMTCTREVGIRRRE